MRRQTVKYLVMKSLPEVITVIEETENLLFALGWIKFLFKWRIQVLIFNKCAITMCITIVIENFPLFVFSRKKKILHLKNRTLFS